MSRIPIASLANGVLFATEPFASPSNPAGVPVLTPAVGIHCFVYGHNTATPATVFTDESGSTPLALPLITDASGVVPGWVDPTLLPLDLAVALVSGNETFVLSGGGGTGTITKAAVIATGLAPADIGALPSFNTRTGAITLLKADVTATGLAPADIAAATATALTTETSNRTTADALLVPLTQKAVASGVASLDGSGQVPLAQLGNASPVAQSFTRPGVLAVETSSSRLPFPAAATIVSVMAIVNTAPTGASVIVDILKNGTTIFTTPGNRPTIAAAANASSAAVPDVTAVAAGNYLQVQVVQVGSTVTGADLTVIVAYH